MCQTLVCRTAWWHKFIITHLDYNQHALAVNLNLGSGVGSVQHDHFAAHQILEIREEMSCMRT